MVKISVAQHLVFAGETFGRRDEKQLENCFLTFFKIGIGRRYIGFGDAVRPLHN